MNIERGAVAGWLLSIPLLVSAGLMGELLRGTDQSAPTGDLISPEVASSPAAFEGLKKLAAGLAWVGAYGDWHRRDAMAMASAMEWAVQLDPDTLVYWLDGARMKAYDVPAWYREVVVSEQTWEQLRRTQLLEAIAWLDRAREIHPHRSALAIEQAVLWWSVTKDAKAAEEALAAAQRCKDVPWFVARVRAEMLVKLGRDQEALELLRDELPRLDPDDPLAMRTLIEERIDELSGKLRESF